MPNIRTIRLSDGQVYAVYDPLALHIDANGNILTDHPAIDAIILNGHLKITEIDDVPVSSSIDNVLVAYNVGTAAAPVYEVRKRDTDQLLEDIGGYSCAVDTSTNTLSLQLGRQTPTP